MSPGLSSGIRAFISKKDGRQNRTFGGTIYRIRKEIKERNRASMAAADSNASGARASQKAHPPQFITRSQQKHLLRSLKALEQGEEISLTRKNIADVRVLGEIKELNIKAASNPRLAIRMADRANRRQRALLEKTQMNSRESAAPSPKEARKQEVLRERRMQARARAERREANEKERGVIRSLKGTEQQLSSSTSIEQAMEEKRRRDEEQRRQAGSVAGGLD